MNQQQWEIGSAFLLSVEETLGVLARHHLPDFPLLFLDCSRERMGGA